MAYSLVQAAGSGTPGGAPAVTFDATGTHLTAGHLLLFLVSTSSGTAAPTGISDGTRSALKVLDVSSTGRDASVWGYVVPPSTTAGATWIGTGGSGGHQMVAYELTGGGNAPFAASWLGAGSVSVGAQASALNDGGSGTSITPAVAGALIGHLTASGNGFTSPLSVTPSTFFGYSYTTPWGTQAAPNTGTAGGQVVLASLNLTPSSGTPYAPQHVWSTTARTSSWHTFILLPPTVPTTFYAPTGNLDPTYAPRPGLTTCGLYGPAGATSGGTALPTEVGYVVGPSANPVVGGTGVVKVVAGTTSLPSQATLTTITGLASSTS